MPQLCGQWSRVVWRELDDVTRRQRKAAAVATATATARELTAREREVLGLYRMTRG